jgi:hypothetical protein
MCCREFGVADDGLPTVVWLGEPIPQIFFQPHLGEWHIYVGRGASPWQVALQGGHEAFHRVCSPPALLHWADEMLAVLFSLHYLDEIRDHENAAANRALFREHSLLCSREQMKAARTIPFPHGFYGRAYVVGSELCGAVGWETVKPLALLRKADQTADIQAWLDSLPPDRRASAVTALGDENGLESASPCASRPSAPIRV